MSRKEELAQELNEIVAPIIEKLDLVLVDIIVKLHRDEVYIEVLADKPEGGIGLDECTRINREAAKKIEEEDLIPENYSIEVSSPGLDRPLKTEGDFRRVTGKEVDVYLREPFDGRVQYTGKVKAASGEEVVIETKTGEVNVPVALINKGVQVISLKNN